MSDWTGAGTTITSPSSTYATVAELKTWIGISDTVDDTLLATVLAEASLEIDNHVGRHFYQSAAGTVRYYKARRTRELWIDDCVTLTAVATDNDGDRIYETAWAATDYDLWPANASADLKPYMKVQVAPNGRYRFPVEYLNGVKLTGTWGWPSVPEPIKRACILRAAWLFKRKDSPLGMSGNADLGFMRVGRWDSDFEKLLEIYRQLLVG
jgi:hypothetical protein